MGANQRMAEAALEYADRGWSVIPCIGKEPAGRWKPNQSKAADTSELRRMFERKSITGLAVIHGAVSGGLVCRDYDKRDAYRDWAAAHRRLAKTLPTARTKRGHHVYFQGPALFAVLDDGEYRGDSGHYTVLPPSIHPRGGIYEWLIAPTRTVPAIDPVEVGLLPANAAMISEETEVDDPIEHAIVATLPTGPGQRNRKVFDLARALKAIFPKAEPKRLHQIVETWFARCRHVVTTKDFEETWEDFVVAWSRIKHSAPGIELDRLIEEARRMPTIEAAAAYKEPKMRMLVAVCSLLQRQQGDQPFWLATRTAAEKVLNSSAMDAYRKLKVLVFDGVLELVTEGKLKDRQAAQYRFIGDQRRKRVRWKPRQ